MNDVMFFALVGLATGSLYAMLASGLVCAFKGSGVINFAHGALAMYPAYTLDEMQKNGDFFLPWFDFIPGPVDLPVRVSVADGPVDFFPAMVVALLMAAFLGVLVHFLVFRPLRHAPPLGKVVGSLGILLYLQGIALLNFGPTVRQPGAVLPSEPLDGFLWFDRPLPRVNLWLVGICVIVGLVLWFFYRNIRTGIATRAAAGNEKGAILLGYTPERLALTNWIISAVLAGIAGILVAPVTGLDPVRFTLFIVPALGAALLGGLTSIPLAIAAGLALGSLQSIVQNWATESWFPSWARTGASMAVPLIVIVVVLFVRGNSIPVRGSVIENRLPRSPQPQRIWQHALIWPSVVFLLSTGVSIGGVTLVPKLTATWQLGLTTSLILAILSLSYVVLVGYMGQISLAQLALAGTAAFVTVRLMSDGEGGTLNGPGLSLLIAVPAGMAVAVIIGMLVGLPALRIRGVQLAVVTLAAVMMIEEFFFKNPELTGLTTGAGAKVPEPKIFGLDLGVVSDSGLSDSRAFTMFVVVVLTLCAVAVANLRRGDTGRRFLAVRGNERAAAAAGVDVTRTKLLAFAIASALAGLSGIMMGFQQQTISSANFALLLGLATLAFAYLGGITSVNGAIVAGLIGTGGLNTVFMRYHFEGIVNYITVFGGIGLILTSISHPGGIALFVQPLIQKLGNFILHARTREWARAAGKVLPIAAVGALAGWLIWARRDKYSWWMILLGVYLALLIYGMVMRVTHGRRAAVGDAQSEGLLVLDDAPGPLTTAAAADEALDRAPQGVTS